MANDTFNGQAFGAPPGTIIAPLQLQSPGYHCAKFSGAVKPVLLSVNGAADTTFTSLFTVIVPGGLVRPGAYFRASSLFTISNSANTKNVQHAMANVGDAPQTLGQGAPTTADESRIFSSYASIAGDPVPGFRGANNVNSWAGGSSASMLTRNIDVSRDWYVVAAGRWTAPVAGEFIQLESMLFELWP